jgi:hypothetical protein
MDVMLESRAWGEKFISNAFPYLVEDITKVNEKDLKNMKKCFSHYLKKYEVFKGLSPKELPGTEIPRQIGGKEGSLKSASPQQEAAAK